MCWCCPRTMNPSTGCTNAWARCAIGQEQTLERLRQSLTGGPQRIVDVFPALFHRAIDEQDGQQLSLATGEAGSLYE